MALVTCPECGNKVSDKATVCLKCGYPIEDILAAKEIEEKEKVEKEKQLKHQLFAKRIKVTFTIVIICLMLAIAFVIAHQPDRSGLFDGIKWRSQLSEIELKYPDGWMVNEKDGKTSYYIRIEQYESIDGVSALVSLQFDDNDLLYKVFIVVMVDEDILPYYKAAQQLKHRFENLYGESSRIDNTEYWNTSESKIELWHLNAMITVIYYDVNHLE
ncbi:zinc ribbon domain-containing protein [Oribacterium sp. WCC10]|uniref:zinc ribbon domain-containing protein n=1 Tax=Oribacterium sp. WCC10 TaxID=1855343 RepID=UPI0008F0254C|nr:zinc ribbon domain-containing protein [Oribacterium sp. WCC10]SFG57632.1 zinc-ribbon domain-containing protein [Oribacterium sp. WCC10]